MFNLLSKFILIMKNLFLLFIVVLLTLPSCATYNFRETPSTKLAMHESTYIFENPITGLKTYRLDIPFVANKLDRRLIAQVPGVVQTKKDKVNPYAIYYSICHICDEQIIFLRIDDLIKKRTKEDLQTWLTQL